MSQVKIGFFGLLGSGNLGNDGSFAAVLGYLRAAHADAQLHAFCSGPAEISARYGVPAVRMNWYQAEYRTASGIRSKVGKVVGKLVDAVRIARWVRARDLVIVPGMGVLETTLPMRPWGWPYSQLLLCLSGKLLGTKVVLLSVGAERIGDPMIRVLYRSAARLASYRSYRDEISRDAMRELGVATAADPVYPDLAFGLRTPERPAARGVVGVGVMAYCGGNEDRGRAEEIYRDYVTKLTGFVRWLVHSGRQVVLFTGDRMDEAVANEITCAVGSASVRTAFTATLDDVILAIAEVETVVASRYHNVLCALMLAKPTISLGYAAKNDVLMERMGLGEFCQSIREIDTDLLIKQHVLLEERGKELTGRLVERNKDVKAGIERQFAELSALISPATTTRPEEVACKR